MIKHLDALHAGIEAVITDNLLGGALKKAPPKGKLKREPSKPAAAGG